MTLWNLLFLLYSLLLINFVYGYDDVLLVLEQNENCNIERGILEVLSDLNIYKTEGITIIVEKFRAIVSKYRLQRYRLQKLNPPDQQPIFQNFSLYTKGERRDQIMGVIYFMAHSWGQHFRGNTYLPHLEMDIIHEHLSPVSRKRLSTILSQFPCWKYPPETDITSINAMQTEPHIGSKKSVYPNDIMLNGDTFSLGSYYIRSQYDSNTKDDFVSISAIQLSAAWAKYRGENTNTVIGLVDTGCSMHPDLESKYCASHEDCAGYDFGENDDNPYKEPLLCQHGTSMAGLLAAVPNNYNFSAGVCWGCKIMCMKVADSRCTILLTSVLKAYDYLLGKNIRVILSTTIRHERRESELSALKKLSDALIAIVVPAGNDGCWLDSNNSTTPTCKKLPYPASFSRQVDNLIVVGAVYNSGEYAAFSNYGIGVKVVAPGFKITCIRNTLSLPSSKGTELSSAYLHQFCTGTSVSAALVAGTVALVFSYLPEATPALFMNSVIESCDIVRGFIGSQLLHIAHLLHVDAIMDRTKEVLLTNGTVKYGIPDDPTPKISPPVLKDKTIEYYPHGSMAFTFNQIYLCFLLMLLCFVIFP